MHGAQPGVGQCHPAVEGAQREVRARGKISPVGERTQQGAGHTREAVAAQRIHPGGRSQRGRQAERELGIHQGHPGQHQRTAQTDFGPVGGRTQHRVAGRFRPRARGGRYGDEGNGRMDDGSPGSDDFGIVERIAWIGQQHGESFAGIDHAAPAHRDHHARSDSARSVEPPADQIKRGLTVDAQMQDRLEPFAATAGFSGHQEQPGTEGRHQRGQFGPLAGSEHDALRGGELEVHEGRLTTAVIQATLYFTLVRGSAIRSATASRHAA